MKGDGERQHEEAEGQQRTLVYLVAVVHGLSEPDVLLLLDVLAEVPVLLGDLTLSWGDASLSSLHVAVDLDGILSASLVGVDPVLAWRTKHIKMREEEVGVLLLSQLIMY